MRINKTITLSPAYHKWASQRTNFSEWVERQIDRYHDDISMSDRITTASTGQLGAALLARYQNGETLPTVILDLLLDEMGATIGSEAEE